MKNDSLFRKAVIINTILWLFVTTIAPNLLIILISFTKKDPEQLINFSFTLENFSQALSPLFLKVYFNSLKIGIISVVLCLIFGYAYAFIMYREKNKFIKYFLLIAIIIPFWTSSLIRTYSIIFILKLNGFLNKLLLATGLIDSPLNMLYSNGAVIFGFVYTLIPFMIIPIFLSLRKIEYSLIESAKDLGASSTDIFLKIILPLSSTGVISGCSMVLLSSLGMFYLSDLLGGSKTVMIGNLIKDQILLNNNWNLASAISVILYLIVIFGIIFQRENYKINFHVSK
ncbi:ABC transporter permease [Candidatus Bandiella numerosa]|uniref:ABC transporter permease n=1 Tax=Candidatus Bandiella numerosa TaxID=2570586 RepID=UPI001F021654|nr:ABC transporter permease subunit [Candidatus Bandiella numerosa]